MGCESPGSLESRNRDHDHRFFLSFARAQSRTTSVFYSCSWLFGFSCWILSSLFGSDTSCRLIVHSVPSLSVPVLAATRLTSPPAPSPIRVLFLLRSPSRVHHLVQRHANYGIIYAMRLLASTATRISKTRN